METNPTINLRRNLFEAYCMHCNIGILVKNVPTHLHWPATHFKVKVACWCKKKINTQAKPLPQNLICRQCIPPKAKLEKQQIFKLVSILGWNLRICKLLAQEKKLWKPLPIYGMHSGQENKFLVQQHLLITQPELLGSCGTWPHKHASRPRTKTSSVHHLTRSGQNRNYGAVVTWGACKAR